MRMRFNIIGVIAAASMLLSACNLLPQQQQTAADQFFAGLAAKATADLTAALATAKTPVPNMPGGIVDQAGASCLGGSGGAGSIGGLLGAQALVNAILANSTTSGAGGITAAEVGSLLLPGSPQLNALMTGLAADCGQKMQQVNAALVLGTAGWFTALGAQFAIAMAPVGAEGPRLDRYAIVIR